MADNALIRRFRFSTLRPTQVWIFVSVYVLITAVILTINGGLRTVQDVFDDTTDMFHSLYYQFMTIQVLLVVVWAGANSASVLRNEVTGKTIEFFRMLPLSPAAKSYGVIVGRNLLVLIMAAVNGVILTLWAFMGRVSPGVQIQMGILLVAIACLANFVALLGATQLKPTKRTTSRAGGIIVLLFVVPNIIRAMIDLSDSSKVEQATAMFFGMRFPLLLTIAAVAFYFAAWAWTGILRRFRYEREPVFTAIGALHFMIGFCVIVLGFFWESLAEHGHAPTLAFWIVTLLPLVIIPFGFMRSAGWYQERISIERNRGPALLIRSNLTLAAGLYLIWAVFTAVSGWRGHVSSTLVALTALVSLGFYMFLMLLFELRVVLVKASRRIGVLLGTIAVLYVVVPLFIAPIFEVENLLVYTPFGFYGMLFDSDAMTEIPFLTIVAAHLVLSLLPAVMIAKRYARLVARRTD